MNSQTHNDAQTVIADRIKAFSAEQISEISSEFQECGFVRIPSFLPEDFLMRLLSDCDRIVDRLGKDKDLLMKNTNNTPRRMKTVGQHILAEHSAYIPQIYASEEFREFLRRLAGEDVHRPPWPPEEFVLSNLYRNGDTHGWHWDDYSYAFVLYLKAPDVSQGGFVQTCGGGSWDKSNPKVNETLLSGPIYTHRCESGDAYFLNAQKYLHRVTPITNNGERLIVNMTWANTADLEANMTHETNDVLFAS